MMYFLIGKKGDVKKVILSSHSKPFLEDLKEVLGRKGFVEMEVLEKLEFGVIATTTKNFRARRGTD